MSFFHLMRTNLLCHSRLHFSSSATIAREQSESYVSLDACAYAWNIPRKLIACGGQG